MKKLFPLVLSLCLFTSLMTAQQAPVELCADVEYDGDMAVVTVMADQFSDILSFQVGVAWETAKYTFVSVDNLHESVPVAFNQVDDVPAAVSLLRTVWFDQTAITPQTLDNGSVLFTVTLQLNDPNEIGLIGIAPDNDFQIEFVNGSVEEVAAVIDGVNCSTLAFNTLLSSKDITIQEMNVSPNPFTDKLVISLDEAINGTFSVYSSTGKLIKQNISAKGTEINLDFSDFAQGTYLLKYISKDKLTQGQIQIFKM